MIELEEKWKVDIDVINKKPVLVVENDSNEQICNLSHSIDKQNRLNSLLIANLPDLYNKSKQLLSIIDTPVTKRRMQGNTFYEEAIKEFRDVVFACEQIISQKNNG